MNQNLNFTITSKKRLDVFLRDVLPQAVGCEISNSKIRRLIMAGCVMVDGRAVRVPSFELRVGSKVSAIIDKEKLLYEKQTDDIKFEVTPESVLYEDDYLIFINKPAHFPTEKTIVDSRDNLHDAVVRYLWNKNPALRNPPYVGIMHRLDKETSGVILFTKKREVNKAIFDMFDSAKLSLEGSEIQPAPRDKTTVFSQPAPRANQTTLDESADVLKRVVRPVKKTYIAAVVDSPKIRDFFTVKNYLGRISSKSSQGKWGSVPQSKGGMIAITEFKVRQRRAGNSIGQDSTISRSRRANLRTGICILECHPITGRTHQIRVHLAESGFPIIGDSLYGGRANSRLMLHAESLELIHPVTGKKLCVKSEADWQSY
ncbi:RluA family pseudouridine synthase [Treponema sp.]|uniref:RluA family pseudouridine synthase n=1 Tax=Treponema sp. TaxID=166 RepID=UPI00298EAC71|nr:RluA family pseudouridine synthase [Treponema sp.]MCR5613834.1 RluA family pseudouridine synthase [Treponema sp.]